MTTRRSVTALSVAALSVAITAAAGCSSGDGTDLDARTTAITIGDQPADASSVPGGPDATTAPGEVTLPGEVVDVSGSPAAPEAADVVTSSIVVVPETGVPGLDSTDAFCAAWSRFAGSYQVIAVNAAFGSGPVEDRAVLEVIAAPTVDRALDDLAAHWPDELAAERESALDGVYGPFGRRLAVALTELDDAGASAGQLAGLEDAWLETLSERNTQSPDVFVDLDDELVQLVVDTTADYLASVGPLSDDESLVTDIEIPATDAYLATTCPDRGVLSGGEVDG